MLQRNTSGAPLIPMTLTPLVEVAPGELIDAPELLAGFEEVKDAKSETDTPVLAAPEMPAGDVEADPVAAPPADASSQTPAQPVPDTAVAPTSKSTTQKEGSL